MNKIKIVESWSKYGIENDINELLKDGWKLYGDMKIYKDKDDDVVYVIVLVK